jgi:hypothetical protein
MNQISESRQFLGIFLSVIIECLVKLEMGGTMLRPELIVAMEFGFSEGIQIIVFEQEMFLIV